MKFLKLQIVTPDTVMSSEDYVSATVPTSVGQLTILANHVPLITKIVYGEIILKTAKGNQTFLFVYSGVLEIRPNSRVIILADHAQRAESIDVERAEDAKKRVEKILKEKRGQEDVDYVKLQAILEKEMARIKVGRKYKNIKK